MAAESLITVGPVGPVVLSLAEQLKADLVVLGSHGWSTADHASVTERVIDESPCPVLTFQERVDMPGFRLRSANGDPAPRTVVSTDHSRASSAAVGYACALARVLPLELELRHVVDPGHAGRERYERAQAALEALVPPDLGKCVSIHVRGGRRPLSSSSMSRSVSRPSACWVSMCTGCFVACSRTTPRAR